MSNQQLLKCHSVQRTNQSLTMKNGFVARIIEYHNSLDIDIIFEEIDVIVRNKQYTEFSNKQIKIPLQIYYIDDHIKVTNYNINKGISFLIDKEDINLILNRSWHINNSGYATSNKTKNRNGGMLHRIIMNPKENEQVDHINGDKLDNRKRNLRICNHGQNKQNSLSKNQHGFKGISKVTKGNNKPWQAIIRANKNIIYLGVFATKNEAAQAYNEAALKYHGEFAKLNKLDD